MNFERELSRRINLRLTPTDRLTIERIVELSPSTASDAIRFAIHTAFLLVQCIRDAALRLVLRNDELQRQEDIDITLAPEKSRASAILREPEPSSGDVLQIRLTGRSNSQLDALLSCGFASNRTATVRRALNLHYQVLSRTRMGYRFGTLGDGGEFTALPLLDLVYPERSVRNSAVKAHTLQPLFGSATNEAGIEREGVFVQPSWRPAMSAVDSLDPQGRYELLRELNSNALSQRYLARDRRLGRLCLAKVARIPSRLGYEDRTRLFESELVVTSRSGTDGLMGAVIDAGLARWADADLPFMVIDTSGGRTLDDEIHDIDGGRELPAAIRLMEDIIRVLAGLHRRQFIHGDLNPRNILVMGGGELRLADFGLCLGLSERSDTIASIVAAMADQANDFTPPEFHACDTVIDLRSDIYSLGAIFKYILKAWQLDRGASPDDDLSRAWATAERAIEVALRRYPEDRFQTVEEFWSALRTSEEAVWLASIGENSAIPHRRSLSRVLSGATNEVSPTSPDATSAKELGEAEGTCQPTENVQGDRKEAKQVVASARNNDTDEDLVTAWRSGDLAAFGCLYARYSRALSQYFARRFSGDMCLAEDLVQETFVSILKKPDRFDQAKGRFRAWLFYEAMDLLRTERARLSRAEGIRAALSNCAPDDELSADCVPLDCLQGCLKSLSERERHVMWVTALEGYTIQQAAELLKVAPSALRLWKRGLKLQRRNEQMLNELLEGSGATVSKRAPGPSIPRSGAQVGKLSAIERARRDSAMHRSLVHAEVVQSSGQAQFGAAASHKMSVASAKRRRFLLRWKQEEHEWKMEGLSAGSSHEVVLCSADGSQPESITWKNPATGRADTYKIESRSDGRTFVDGISVAQARKRVEALRDATDEAARTELLPIVHLVGDAM